jgi:D-3-phosphoglycerate dehydrogenase
MEVLGWGRESTLARAREAGLTLADSMDALFRGSDVLSVQLRLNDDTRAIVRYEHLTVMKPDAIFVNASRAELVAPGALGRALGEGRPGKAALDVFENEPLLGRSDPLLALPNVIGTPHLGFVERDSFERYFGDAFDAINAFAAGQPVRVVA